LPDSRAFADGSLARFDGALNHRPGVSVGLPFALAARTTRASSGKWRIRIQQSFCAFLILAACSGDTVRADEIYTGKYESNPPTEDPYFAVKIQDAGRKQQEKFRPRIPIPDAVGDNVRSLTATRRAMQQSQARAATQASEVSPEDLAVGVSVFVAVVLAAGLGARKLAPDFLPAVNAGLNPLRRMFESENRLSTKVRAEEETLSEFLAALRAGPMATGGAAFAAATTDPAARAEAIRSFYEKAPAKLEMQRRMVREIQRTADEGGRQKILGALRWELHAIRAESGVPELLPVWQLAFAVEGLLKQLTDNASNVTASVLRTLEGGMALLEEISRPGVEPDLLTRQALRLLAADDDLISRKAVALALKRALNEPDLAEDGKAALALATANVYDVIFLDVQMPGMDGFELCTKVHQTETNRSTPVVFVTSQSDFEARAKSTLSGGSDLIGKPFLTFEITVKALTLALRGRLGALAEATKAVVKSDTTALVSRDQASSSLAFADGSQAADTESEALELATEFLSRASEHLSPLRGAFKELFHAPDDATRQDLLADIFWRIHSFTPKENLPVLHPAIQLSKTVEGLLRKLLEHPVNSTGSTLFTLASGVKLLGELCALSPDTEIMSRPPIRLLVVDDDPIARRAMAMTLQMTFGKPEVADSGEAAVTCTADRPYDVIFMDVQMPVMDGLEACGRIRRTKANGATPVIFVTGQTDAQTRARMSASGGSDFVAKPFLTSELTLKALTFALRGRLEQRLRVGITNDEPLELVEGC